MLHMHRHTTARTSFIQRPRRRNASTRRALRTSRASPARPGTVSRPPRQGPAISCGRRYGSKSEPSFDTLASSRASPIRALRCACWETAPGHTLASLWPSPRPTLPRCRACSVFSSRRFPLHIESREQSKAKCMKGALFHLLCHHHVHGSLRSVRINSSWCGNRGPLYPITPSGFHKDTSALVRVWQWHLSDSAPSARLGRLQCRMESFSNAAIVRGCNSAKPGTKHRSHKLLHG